MALIGFWKTPGTLPLIPMLKKQVILSVLRELTFGSLGGCRV